jgi:hypothetical protein
MNPREVFVLTGTSHIQKPALADEPASGKGEPCSDWL